MNKKIFLAVLLCLLAVLAISCGGSDTKDECKHNRVSDKLYEPDCSLEGYILHVCLDCGHSYKSDFTAPFGHKITSTVIAPTCTAEGYTEYACTECGYTYKAGYTQPTGHTLTSQITPQTCTAGGYTLFTCACGYSYKTAFVIPNGHNLTVTTVAPTCTADGYNHYKCNHCDYEHKSDFVPMTHTLIEEKVAPTCTEQGYTKKTCSICKYVIQTDFVAPTGHTFVESTVAPTFNTSGYTFYSCSCGYHYKGDYRWYSNIFTGVEGNENTIFAHGVDLSYHDKNVDFKKLAADGVDFVILRLGYLRDNRAVVDNRFEEYYAAARQAGLDIGAYIFTYKDNTDEMIDLTEQLLKKLKGKIFEYPIYLDLEITEEKVNGVNVEVDDDKDGLVLSELSKETLMEMCREYCELLVQEGFFPGIYAGQDFIQNHMNYEQLVAQYEVWVAHYRSSLNQNYYINDYSMFQYSSTGTVAGVTTDVDLNVSYKNYPAIIKKFGYNGYGG